MGACIAQFLLIWTLQEFPITKIQELTSPEQVLYKSGVKLYNRCQVSNITSYDTCHSTRLDGGHIYGREGRGSLCGSGSASYTHPTALLGPFPLVIWSSSVCLYAPVAQTETFPVKLVYRWCCCCFCYCCWFWWSDIQHHRIFHPRFMMIGINISATNQKTGRRKKNMLLIADR